MYRSAVVKFRSMDVESCHLAAAMRGIKNIHKKGVDKWCGAEYNLLVLLILLKDGVVESGNIYSKTACREFNFFALAMLVAGQSVSIV